MNNNERALYEFKFVFGYLTIKEQYEFLLLIRFLIKNRHLQIERRTGDSIINKLNLKINIVGLIPLTENMPSGSATKPGDVVTSMDGTTIEILNTDAEGRLILCDALSYSKKYKPKYVIDIATLTGACVVALGNENTGLFSNDQSLAKKLLHSGKKSLDTAWEMPLGDNYRKLLNSNFADIANIGGRMAGSVTAACFLEHFVKDLKWAHLDIAGTAWKSNNKKATGRPIPLLMNFVLNEADDSN